MGNLGFRGWYYFRQGWSLYFAFILAAINTLTVTYFLAVENYPILQEIFPTFPHYIAAFTAIGVPLLMLIGYIHYKKSPGFRSEASVNFESNPFSRRTLINSELNLKLNIQILDIISNMLDEKSENEDKKIPVKKLKNDIEKFVQERKFENSKDLEFLKDLYNK